METYFLSIKVLTYQRTIEFHLEKERRYYDKGIKVLSLFFIDEVANYRTVNGEKGVYAQIFEEEYEKALVKFPELKFDKNCHDGYFSQDKKGNFKNTRGDTNDDFTTYQTIMQKKEWLLSFDCPLRFIFSHSALKEGWDNPNVFQVCTLIDQKSAFTARQKIGRGLRLCVNQDGERIEDKNINQLHVIANESFAEFADNLQKEIEQETGVKFGYLQISMFAGQTYEAKVEVEKEITPEQAEVVRKIMCEAREDYEIELPPELEPVRDVIIEKMANSEEIEGIKYTETVVEEKTFSYEEATELVEICEKKGYTKKGKIQDTMRDAIKNHRLDLGRYEIAVERFEQLIKTSDTKPPIRDASRDVTVRLKKQWELSPEFVALWDKISQKTTYRVNFDIEELVRLCVKSLQEMERLPKTHIVSKTADYDVGNLGVSYNEKDMRTVLVDDDYEILPNLPRLVSEQVLILPTTVLRILRESGRVEDFLNNPQLFAEKFIEIIKFHRHSLAIDGISYIKLDGEYYYAQEIFDSEELLANLDKNAISVQKSMYDYVVYDSSSIERPFATALDNDPNVKLFFKIPPNFKIDTPIGTYTPDWAVYMEQNGDKKLYFVIETKGSTSLFDLRTAEQLKIHCGKAHFTELGMDMKLATKWADVKPEIC